MRRRVVMWAVFVALVGVAWVVARRSVDRVDAASTVSPVDGPAGQADAAYTPEDRRIFRATMERARAERLDTLPVGAIVARLGSGFVGAPYTPNTLDPPGPERLVVNLREFDCVTFVENMLAMARVVEAGAPDFDAYLAELTRIRYRNGRLDGYPSRLHYFSEWIADNAAKGIVHPMTAELGGIADPEPLGFMSAHADAYWQLGEARNAATIHAMEARLSAEGRLYIPEAEIAAAAPGIRSGDIIAATSTLEGLDVAHTGIALWVDGRLHLMHAPLVGRAVEISDLPLADRILRISGQDGIMVARP